MKCFQYWPETVGTEVEFRPFRVTLLEENRYSEYLIRKFSVMVGLPLELFVYKKIDQSLLIDAHPLVVDIICTCVINLQSEL